jgi:orotidine-5'-phosphate decarboxylase
MKTKLIVALDVEDIKTADNLIKNLKGVVDFYKIGMRLFTAQGTKAVDLVHRHGGKVFLDLKFLDIPQTVAGAVKEAARLGVESVSLHLSGGPDMIRAAAALNPRPKLWGVTVLTSFKKEDVRIFHERASLPTLVRNLARLGLRSGIDAVICSGNEVEFLRKSLKDFSPRFVTPGIRLAGEKSHDQKRVMTPEEAAALEIDYIVVGRPILEAKDPLSAAQKIINAIQSGNSRP